MAVGSADGVPTDVEDVTVVRAPEHAQASPPSVVVRAVLAWLLGLVGTYGAVRGWGPVQYPPGLQGTGLARLGATTAAFVVVATWRRSSPLVVLGAAAVTLPLTAALTASTLGRAPGLVAALSVVVAFLALVPVDLDLRHRHPAPPAGHDGVVLTAVAVLGVAQLIWVAGASSVVALLGVLMAAAVVALGRLAAERIAPVEVPLRRVVTALTAGAATVGAAGTSALRRRPGASLWQRVRNVPAWIWWALVSAAAVAAVMAPLFARFAREPAEVLGFSDYVTHLDVAARVEFFPPRVGAPHPVFHFAVASLSWLGQVPAATIFMSVVVAATVLVLVWFGRQPFAGRAPLDPSLAIAYGVGYFLVESPAMVAAALNVGNPYDWAPTNHMFLSPTDTLLVPFAVVLVVLLGRVIAPDAPASVRHGWSLAVATALTTIAKPSMTLALLVAVPAVVVLSRALDRDLIRVVVTRFYVPSLVVVGLQTWMLEAGVEDIAPSGIAIRPFETIRFVGLDGVGPLMVAPVLVVFICLWAGGRRYLAEPVVQLSLWSMGAALVVLFLLNETGERSHDGTFTKPAFIAFIVLHLVSWRFLAGEYRHDEGRRPRPWVAVSAVFLAVGVVGAVVTYLEAVGLMQLPQRAGT